MSSLVIRVDGGSRGNPGPAAYGVVVADESGTIIARLHKYLGCHTNNYAEYQGLLAGLQFAVQGAAKQVRVYADSELLVRQMQGRYRVKSPHLQPLYEEARRLVQSIPDFRIDHVYREANSEADRLANLAMDEARSATPIGKP